MEELNDKKEIVSAEVTPNDTKDKGITEELLPKESTSDIETNVTTTEEDVEVAEVSDEDTQDDSSDVFITENDTFDIKISYYKVGKDFCVESVDPEFDPKNPDVKYIEMTFKYPSQGDYETIIAQNAYKTPDKMTLIDVLQMELTRLVILIRKWSLKAEFNRMIDLDTKIVKAMANKVRDNIGVKGIL
jgi:hypothetical protein